MYQIEKFDKKIKIKISASYILMEKICSEVEKFSNEKEFEDRKFALLLCTREALTNAITHGGKNNINKKIQFEIEYRSNAMYVSIEDEGDGFDWKKKKSEPDKLVIRGRGRNIINIYSDEMSYNDKGNKIKFLINNE